MIDKYLKGWLMKAMNDIRLIQNEFTLPDDKIVTDALCLHSQQATEKFLKSFLIFNTTEFAKTHNLSHLLSKCIEIGKLDLGNMNYYGMDVRYGEDFYLPSIEETKEAYRIASKVKDFVLGKLKIKEEDLKKY